MRPARVLGTSVGVSVLLHVALWGALLFSTRSLGPSDQPLRIRIIQPPAPLAGVPAPAPAPPLPRTLPPARSGSSKIPEERVERRPAVRDLLPAEPGKEVARRPSPVEERPAPSPPAPVTRPPAEPPPPLDAKREPIPERPPLPEVPSKSGLSLGGSDWRGTAVPAPNRQSGNARQKSLREQLEEIGSSLTAETGKRTVSLDSRDPDFQGYLARLKRRVERVWVYPDQAVEERIGGELLLVFTLNKAGSLTDIRLLRSSGFPILDDESLRAIRVAAPFDPFPPELGEEPWNILATFRYNLPRQFRRR